MTSIEFASLVHNTLRKLLDVLLYNMLGQGPPHDSQMTKMEKWSVEDQDH